MSFDRSDSVISERKMAKVQNFIPSIQVLNIWYSVTVSTLGKSLSYDINSVLGGFLPWMRSSWCWHLSYWDMRSKRNQGKGQRIGNLAFEVFLTFRLKFYSSEGPRLRHSLLFLGQKLTMDNILLSISGPRSVALNPFPQFYSAFSDESNCIPRWPSCISRIKSLLSERLYGWLRNLHCSQEAAGRRFQNPSHWHILTQTWVPETKMWQKHESSPSIPAR